MIDDEFMDWDHGQAPDHKEIGLRLAGLIAEKYTGELENVNDIKSEFVEEYSRLVESGEVWSPSRKQLAAEKAWSDANQKARRMGDRLIVDLASGKAAMIDIENELPHLIVVGRKRRVSLRTLTSLDLKMMIEVRVLNRDRVVASTATFEDAARKIAEIIDHYGDFGTAVASGAFGAYEASA